MSEKQRPIRRWRAVGLSGVAAILCFFIVAEHAISVPPPRSGIVGLDYPVEPRLRHAELERRFGETEDAFAARLSREIYRRSYFCREAPLSLIERAIQWAHPRPFYLGVLHPSRLECGQCGNKAFIMMELLAEAGIDAEMLFLTGHVILRLADGRVVDPTFGVAPYEWSQWRSVYRGIPAFTPIVAASFHEPGRTNSQDVAVWRRDAAVQKVYFPVTNLLACLLAAIGALSLLAALRQSR